MAVLLFAFCLHVAKDLLHELLQVAKHFALSAPPDLGPPNNIPHITRNKAALNANRHLLMETEYTFVVCDVTRII
jgi:hypothetical protein